MMDAVRTIVWLTARQLFARRRVWLVVAVIALPLLLTVFYRFASEDQPGDRLVFMLGMYRNIVLGVLLPLTAVIFGALTFGGDVEEGTLVYLLVRPVPRALVVAVKYLVAAVITAAVITGALVLSWAGLRDPEVTGVILRAFILAATIGAAIYTAIFAFLGLVTKRGLVVGLLYVIVFENVVTRMMEGVRSLSVREFAVSLAQWASGGQVRWPGYTVPMTTVWVMGGLMLAAALIATARKFGRYEMAERL